LILCFRVAKYHPLLNNAHLKNSAFRHDSAIKRIRTEGKKPIFKKQSQEIEKSKSEKIELF